MILKQMVSIRIIFLIIVINLQRKKETSKQTVAAEVQIVLKTYDQLGRCSQKSSGIWTSSESMNWPHSVPSVDTCQQLVKICLFNKEKDKLNFHNSLPAMLILVSK